MRYVIIGNGAAGATAAFTLREHDPNGEILLIGGESDYFFSRTALMYAFMDRLSLRDLEPHERHVYDELRIQRVRGWVRDLDATARRLTLSNGDEVVYDRLLIATGSRPLSAPWPGAARVTEGIVHLVSLQDLAECERLAGKAHRAVVVGGGLIGIELVECLVHAGLEVDFLVREQWYFPVALDAAEGEYIARQIRRHGVRVHLGEEAAEVLSREGALTGIRTAGGTELECGVLGVAIGVEPAVEWLRRTATPPRLNRGILAAPDLSTSLPYVWTAGDCAELSTSGGGLVEQFWYSAKRQGRAAALSMLGKESVYSPPLFFNSSKFFDVEYTSVGEIHPQAGGGASFHHQFDSPAASIRIGVMDGAVTGFSMLGSRWDHTVLAGWIETRRPVRDVMAALDTAQFDVEFGRLDLGPARRAFEAWAREHAGEEGG